MRIISACTLTLTLASFAQAADVDWKMYGTAAAIDGGVVCFYEEKSIVAQANNPRAWTKCLLQKDLDSLDLDGELGKKIVDSSARKVIKGYVPPIGVVEDMDFDQAIGVIQYEETANLSNIQPHARFFYELNCSERMIRRLSTYVRDLKGKEGFDEKPSDWEYVPPEGSGARLLKILCPMR